MVAINSNLSGNQPVVHSHSPQQGAAPVEKSAAAGAVKDAEQTKKIKELSEEFESIFLNIVLKSMRDSVQKSGLIDGGNAEEIYRSMLDSEYAKTIAAQRSTGLADNIEKFLLDAAQLGDKGASEMATARQGLSHYKQQIHGETLPLMQKSATIE